LAFYFHILTTMHGQNHIKFKQTCVDWSIASVVTVTVTSRGPEQLYSLFYCHLIICIRLKNELFQTSFPFCLDISPTSVHWKKCLFIKDKARLSNFYQRSQRSMSRGVPRSTNTSYEECAARRWHLLRHKGTI